MISIDTFVALTGLYLDPAKELIFSDDLVSDEELRDYLNRPDYFTNFLRVGFLTSIKWVAFNLPESGFIKTRNAILFESDNEVNSIIYEVPELNVYSNKFLSNLYVNLDSKTLIEKADKLSFLAQTISVKDEELQQAIENYATSRDAFVGISKI